MADTATPQDRIPLPPADADVLTTACDYCVVACGYKVYRWPVGREGGPAAADNAFGVDFPRAAMAGFWVSPNQHNIITYKGKRCHVIVIPDASSEVVNVGGDHSIRGGCLARKLYNPDSPTRDRLQRPLMRVAGKLVPVSWDTALEVFAQTATHVLAKHGELAYGQKQFSYGYFENTYALSKLGLKAIGTPCFADHDNPGKIDSTPGFRDVGFDNFAPAYEDWSAADTLYIAGCDPYETKTIIWNEWILKGIQRGMKVIFVLPRKTTGVAWAEKHGGLFLQVTPGTDTVLQMAIQRVILENGWEDTDWIGKYTSNKWESDSGFGQGTRNTPWQWRTTWGKFQTKGFADYRTWLLAQEESKPEVAAKISGVPVAQIKQAAAMLAKPSADGTRPKASFGIEKGSYWSNNYLNTASVADLALVCGSGNRPGRVVGRFGGHQRGGIKAGHYPIHKSPEKFGGRRRKPMDLDRWVEAGNLRFAYVVGCTWIQGMTGSSQLSQRFRDLTVGNAHQIGTASVEAAVAALKKRVDSGGMVVVHQDIYLRPPIGSDYADLVLPASGWGEQDLARANGERRLRLYSKFCDAPGEAKADWWIVGQIGQRMGFDGFDWPDSNAIFEEAARYTRGSRKDYYPLVWKAKRDGLRGHEALRTHGTKGLQCPLRFEDGTLVETKRLHDSTLALPTPQGPTVHSKTLTAFNTQSGKANFIKTPWSLFSDFYDAIKPRDGQFWVTNGRMNETWQTGFDDSRRAYISQRWPENHLEIHPADAERLGIESGDWVLVWNDQVPIQTGGFIAPAVKDAMYGALKAQGHIAFVRGEFKAVAIVTDAVKPGLVYTNALDMKNWGNSVVARVPDPVSNNYRFKLGVGHIKKVGESTFKNDPRSMSFKSRTLV